MKMYKAGSEEINLEGIFYVFFNLNKKEALSCNKKGRWKGVVQT